MSLSRNIPGPRMQVLVNLISQEKPKHDLCSLKGLYLYCIYIVAPTTTEISTHTRQQDSPALSQPSIVLGYDDRDETTDLLTGGVS